MTGLELLSTKSPERCRYFNKETEFLGECFYSVLNVKEN